MSKVSLKLVERNYKEKCYSYNGGYMIDCHIEMRDGESYMGKNRDGKDIVTLQGYAIIPKERYFDLLLQLKEHEEKQSLKYRFRELLKSLFKSDDKDKDNE